MKNKILLHFLLTSSIFLSSCTSSEDELLTYTDCALAAQLTENIQTYEIIKNEMQEYVLSKKVKVNKKILKDIYDKRTTNTGNAIEVYNSRKCIEIHGQEIITATGLASTSRLKAASIFLFFALLPILLFIFIRHRYFIR